ncbi:Uncharacterised protein [Mycobacteroides abscessus subsp. abscessus]|nr:Uncharacterised protein [Mycobacteroides abscessus subsp. abscessus]SIN19388.1 Uncharacterised protein [Mycobacteroides abscessus subsp. abscessus]SKQ66079.1 Uncharacterised protein [Mycobacteroides abscessus subsp. abscessus]SKT54151.1 Uncharacterised protein [Mycobacteroides abscessus subsp. abscessus]SKX40366.1 Uncharacterised protein [Mycobacteroides abscessus subsp. abscessus]
MRLLLMQHERLPTAVAHMKDVGSQHLFSIFENGPEHVATQVIPVRWRETYRATADPKSQPQLHGSLALPNVHLPYVHL